MATTYDKIATTTLSVAASTIDFTSISSAYTDLRLILTTRPGAATYYLYLIFNSDTAANYSRTILDGNGASATSSRSSADNFALIGYMDTTYPTFQDVNIFSYAGSTNKTLLTRSSQDKNGSGQIYNIVGLWRSTSAITSISIKPQTSTIAAGTTATLYGILKA